MSRSRTLLVVPVLVLLAACSGSASVTGEGVIETELADQIGIGELDASCDQPVDDEVGTQFRCSATTEDDRVVEFLAAFVAEDEIFVSPINLLLEAEIAVLKEQSAAVLSPEVGVDIDPAQITCPTEVPLFMTTDLEAGEAVVECTILDPVTETTFPLTITLSDYVIREGYQNLFAETGNAIE